MKTLIDGRVLSRNVITGVERYAKELLAAFRSLEFSFDIAVPGTANRYAQHIWEHTALPKMAGNYDVLFCPANMMPLWKPKGCKFAVTIHDISFLTYKKAYSASYRAYYSAVLNRIVSRADRIITISNFEKTSIAGMFPRHEDKISVVHNGMDERFKLPQDKISLIKDKYLLFVGALNPRKNLEGALRGFEAVKDRIPHKLLIAGASRPIYKAVGKRASDRVEFLGQVSDEQLIELYRKAAVLVFPSFYEGFGLPPLEAMGCGCPVIASSTTAMPEVLGDSALFVDPGSAGSISEAILKAVSDEVLAGALMEKGLKRAALYSWEKAAREMIKIFGQMTRSD